MESSATASACTQAMRFSMRPSRAPPPAPRFVELRRPGHSGSLTVDGSSGRLTYAASLAYAGRHFDSRDTFPFDRVSLGSYWLAEARVAYAIRPGVELFARIANGLNERYQDVFSYRTEPRAGYVGVKAGGSAIIAVKFASATSLPSTLARPANLQTVARF